MSKSQFHPDLAAKTGRMQQHNWLQPARVAEGGGDFLVLKARKRADFLRKQRQIIGLHANYRCNQADAAAAAFAAMSSQFRHK